MIATLDEAAIRNGCAHDSVRTRARRTQRLGYDADADDGTKAESVQMVITLFSPDSEIAAVVP